MTQKWYLGAMLVSTVLLAFGATTAKAGVCDYEFEVQQGASNLTVYAYVDPIFYPSGSDQESTQVSGTMQATLDSTGSTFNEIHITVLDLAAVNESISMSIELEQILLPDIYAHITANDLGVKMGDEYGTVGSPATVTSGTFAQEDNEVQAVGSAEYDVYAPDIYEGEGVKDLSTTPPEETTLEGTIVDNGNYLTLTIDIDITKELDEISEDIPTALIDGYIHIYGTIVGKADKLMGDANGDGAVGVTDLGILATYYGTTGGAEWAEGDFNLDGNVNITDLGILATNYGETNAPPVGGIPEPTTMALLGLGGLALLRRRSRCRR